MADGAGNSVGRAGRFGYAAAAWAFLFAAASFYWAAGGTFGARTNSPAIVGQADTGWFVALLWFVGVLKAFAGLLALALARRWHPPLSRGLLLAGGWGAGLILALYGGANLAVRALMSAGVMQTPDSMRTAAARWHLLLWDPWFLGGGLLFCAAAWQFQRRTAIGRQPAADRRINETPAPGATAR